VGVVKIKKKALLSSDLETEFAKWCVIAANRNQWVAVYGSKIKAQQNRRRTLLCGSKIKSK
jgi:hypothetical protein